jgi:hypothetical protein
MEEIRNAKKFFVQKSDGKRTRGRHRRRWQNNTGMDLRETEWDGVNWIHLAQVAGFCGQGNERSGSIKGGVFLD